MTIFNLDIKERTVIFASLCHVLDREAVSLPDEYDDVGETMFKRFDAIIKGNKALGAISPVVDEAQAKVVWSCLWAYLKDVNAPVDNLTPQQWDMADFMVRTLDRDPEISHLLSYSPRML